MTCQTDVPTAGRATDPRQFERMGRRLVAMKFLTSVGMLGSYFVGILGTLTYAAGGDVLANVLTVASINASMIAGSFCCGALLDARGPRAAFRLVVGSTCAAAAVYQLISYSVPGIVAGAVLFGFAWGTGDAVQRSFPAYLSGQATELSRLNAALSMAVNIAVVVGPLACGALAAVFPARTSLLLAAAGALLGLVPAAGFRALRAPGKQVPTAPEAEGPHAADRDDAGTPAEGDAVSGNASGEKGLSSVLAGFKVVAAAPVLRVLLAAGFLTFFGYGAFDPLESLFYRDVLHVGVSWMGWLSSASGVGALVGALVVMRLPASRMDLRTLLMVLACLGAGSLVYVGTPYVAVAVTGQLILGAAYGALMPLETTLVQTHAPLGSVGRVSAVMGFGYTVAGVIPLVLAPPLAAALGVQGALIGAASCVLLSPIVLRIALRGRLPK